MTSRLGVDGNAVLDVPAKLARRVRLLSSGHGRKSDKADALSVGVAAHTAPRLHTARTDEAITALPALLEHREDLVRTRTQTVNRPHALVTKLVPTGLPRKLTAEVASAALRRVRPRATLGRALRALAVELVAEVRRLDQRISFSPRPDLRRGHRIRHDPHRPAWHRRPTRRQDHRRHSRYPPVPFRCGVRLLLRRRTLVTPRLRRPLAPPPCFISRSAMRGEGRYAGRCMTIDGLWTPMGISLPAKMTSAPPPRDRGDGAFV